MEPVVDYVRLLRPSAMLLGAGLKAHGRWSLGFRTRNDLLFCQIEAGECVLLRSNSEPIHLRCGDFVMIRTDAAFSLASGLGLDAFDSEAAVAASRSRHLTLGQGVDRPVTVRAGKFIFDGAYDEFLHRRLPSFIHVPASPENSCRVSLLLALTTMEAQSPGTSSDFFIKRVAELLLVAALRTAQKRWQNATLACWLGLLTRRPRMLSLRRIEMLPSDGPSRSWRSIADLRVPHLQPEFERASGPDRSSIS